MRLDIVIFYDCKGKKGSSEKKYLMVSQRNTLVYIFFSDRGRSTCTSSAYSCKVLLKTFCSLFDTDIRHHNYIMSE